MLNYQTGMKALHAIPSSELYALLGIPAYWVVGFVIFVALCAVRGVPQTERILKARSQVLPHIVAEYGYWMFQLPIRALLALRVTPDMVTVLSLVAAIASGV